MSHSILIVEDEVLIAHSLDYLLKKLGYRVSAIVNRDTDVVDAVTNLQPDLVLMDINLNSEKDGIELAKDIQALETDIPIIFVTAYTDSITVARAKQLKPFGYVVKPFQERELSICIEIALFKTEAERKLRESELKFENTLRSLGLPVITTDVTGDVTFSNYLATRLLGLEIDEEASLASAIWSYTIPWEVSAETSPVAYACRAGIVLNLPEGSTLTLGTKQINVSGCTISPIIGSDGESSGAVVLFKELNA